MFDLIRSQITQESLANEFFLRVQGIDENKLNRIVLSVSFCFRKIRVSPRSMAWLF